LLELLQMKSIARKSSLTEAVDRTHRNRDMVRGR
jgi:hypothetical protein